MARRSDSMAAKKRPMLPFTLMLVGGVIILLFGLFLGASAAVLSSTTSAYGSTSLVASSLSSLGKGVALVAYVEAAIGIVCGIVVIAVATMLEDNRRAQVKKLSAVALVFSVISIFGGAGLFIGMVLAIVGSILGIVRKG